MKTTNPLSIWVLLGVLLGCAFTVYLLVPNQKRLLTRLLKDGKERRALEVLRSLSPVEMARDPEFYELTRLELSRQLLDPQDKAGVSAQIEASLQILERHSANEDFLEEVLQSLSLLGDCEQASRLVEPHLKTISTNARQILLSVLVKDALAANKPAVAAATYQKCLRPFPPAETNLLEAVRLWKAAAKPEKALAVLEDFERQSGPGAAPLSPALVEVKFNLLRELGRNREAFELASRVAVQSGEAEAAQKWLNRMRASAGTTEQHRQLLSAYRLHVKTAPNDEKTWRLIAEMSVAANDLAVAKEALQKLISLEPGDIAAQRQLAQIYEWSGEPNRAYDLYVKLAEQKDWAALERLIALNPGLYRDNDLLRILRELCRQAPQDKYRLILARLLVRHGEYADANALYQQYLDRAPQDAAILEEYARLQQRQHAFGSALIAWQKLQRLKPDDVITCGQIAEVYYQLGDFDESLQTYRSFCQRSTDLAGLQKFCTLAESMGDFSSLSEALARRMELSKHAEPADFIKLAYVLNLLGADAERQRMLERGLSLFPDNDVLRIQLSVLLVEKKELGRALSVMAQCPNLQTDPDALRFYLNLLIESREFATAERIIESIVPEKLASMPGMDLLRATIYEGNRNYVAAEVIHQKLHQQHPDDAALALDYLQILMKLGKRRMAQHVLQPLLKSSAPEILGEASRLAVELGAYQDAERLQARVMELRGPTRFQDWSHLGDIRYAMGNRSAARRAYRQALASAEMNLSSQPP